MAGVRPEFRRQKRPGSSAKRQTLGPRYRVEGLYFSRFTARDGLRFSGLIFSSSCGQACASSIKRSRVGRGDAPTKVWHATQNESVISGLLRFGVCRNFEPCAMRYTENANQLWIACPRV